MHAGKPPVVGICSHFVHNSVKTLCCKQVVCIFTGSTEKRDLRLFLARLMHRTSEVSLQPTAVSDTMTGTHVYGLKSRLSHSGFIYILYAFGDHAQLPDLS